MDNKEILKILSLLNSSLSEAQRLSCFLFQTLMGAEEIKIPRSKIIMESPFAEDDKSSEKSALDRMQEFEPGEKMVEDDVEEDAPKQKVEEKPREKKVSGEMPDLKSLATISAKKVEEEAPKQKIEVVDK